MQIDPFEERLAKVRQRFACALKGKIDDACGALPRLSGCNAASATLLAETYQQIHKISGVASTVGFAATGKAARRAEEILIPAYRTKRALTADEAGELQAALQALRSAALTELHSLHGPGR